VVVVVPFFARLYHPKYGKKYNSTKIINHKFEQKEVRQNMKRGERKSK
jgi:hypothetical protein